MVYIKNKNTKKSRKYGFLIALLVIISIVALIGSAYTLREPKSTDNPTGTINYNPPTKEEKEAANSVKDQLIEDEKQKDASDTEASKVTDVVIVDASQYDNIVEIRSFAQGVYNNGLCTIRFTKNTNIVEKKAPAFPDAATTVCTNPEIQRSEFSEPGEWQVVVSFNASGVSGSSAPQKITIE